jgi:sterol desaturase/sphingolipid hydroxylase (fatty acid hydroxylase superfamily)
VHHRLGLHYYNFADFPPIDMLFGTFRNPREFHGEGGFDADGDRKMGSILAFVDVNAPLYGAGSRGAKPAATPAAAH